MARVGPVQPPAPFDARFDEATAALTVTGDIDDSNVQDLAAALADRSALDLTVDLTGVTYLPSVAVGALVDALRKAETNGGSVTVTAGPGTIAEHVLRVTGIPHRTD